MHTEQLGYLRHADKVELGHVMPKLTGRPATRRAVTISDSYTRRAEHPTRKEESPSRPDHGPTDLPRLPGDDAA
jgi:hypothetical protein